ncbi:hypothetical protein FXO37_26082 [Capsicum annuum]|nr:hypothetical protein FXO37_26082 [Capsicum annuum]
MVGASANWYALMDKLLILRKSNTTENEEMKSMKENLLELIDLYYDAIDASKSGNKEERYKNYRFEMKEALNTSSESKNDLADQEVLSEVLLCSGASSTTMNEEESSKRSDKLLYEAPDIEKITRRKLDKLTDALVIYRVTYDYTKAIGDVRKCGFSWKVTGSTLCRLHTELDAKTYPNSHVHVTFCIAQIIELEVQRSV